MRRTHSTGPRWPIVELARVEESMSLLEMHVFSGSQGFTQLTATPHSPRPCSMLSPWAVEVAVSCGDYLYNHNNLNHPRIFQHEQLPSQTPSSLHLSSFFTFPSSFVPPCFCPTLHGPGRNKSFRRVPFITDNIEWD